MDTPQREKNPNAVALGKLGAGIPKTLTPEHREQKRIEIACARAARAEKRLAQKKLATP